LQRWQFIASQTGSTTDDLNTGLKKFTVNMGMARAGQGALFTILSRVNPAMLNQMLHAKNTEEAFKLMLGVIQRLPKAQQQAALSQIAFGRGNLSLVSTAKAGSKEYEELGKRIQQIGMISQAQAEQSNATADAWGELWVALQRARDAIIGQTLPALQALAKTFTQFLIDNKIAIQAWGKEFAERLPSIIGGLVSALKAVATVMAPLVSLFAFLGEHTTLLNVAIAFLAELFALKLAFAIYGVVKAVAALNLTLLGTPIGWLIIGLTALIGLGVLIASNWDVIVGTWKEWTYIVDAAIEKIVSFVRAVKSIPSKVMTSLGFSSEDAPTIGAKGAAVSQNRSEAQVKVSFDNLPKGTRVSSMTKDDILDLSMGYAMQ
jgi:hypothetical protein